ncbi:MAG TPA: SRPBCC domain-containing protein [Microlunatus sp.]|nr:SRPBCC domain-containing protein [Microlunatus sp.]
MSPITAHVHQLYIAATPEQVWLAITDSEWTKRFFFGTVFVRPPEAGQPYRTVGPDGKDTTEGTIEELVPPSGDDPGRFVLTWRTLYDSALAAEPPSRVEWTVESAGEGLTRVRLVHGDLAASPLTWASTKTGWPWVLDGLKTAVETGRSLPPRTVQEPGPDPDATVDGDWHRAQGVIAHGETWDLLAEPERTAAADAALVTCAYASAYHWARATGRTPANAARADYLIAKALLATRQPAAALVHAESSLAACQAHGLADFDLAYALEIRARARYALGRITEAEADWVAALAVPIADAEDAGWFASDVSDGLAPNAAAGPASR